MKGLAVLAVLLLAVAKATAEPTTANTFLNAYQVTSGELREQFERKLADIEDGLGWANAYLKVTRKQAPLYCSPDGIVLTGHQLVDILRREVRERPSLGERPTAMALFVSLQRAFPCR